MPIFLEKTKILKKISFINAGSCVNSYLEDGNDTLEIEECKPTKIRSFFVTDRNWNVEKVTVITECGCV